MFPPPSYLLPSVKYAWSHEAKSSFNDSRLLHHKYWNSFNTITIPLLSPEEFYADALAAARDSETVRELEQTLEKRYQQRQDELKDAFKKIRGGIKVGTETSRAAWDASTNGSLSSFARALLGMVLGWDNVDTGDVHLNFEYLLPEDHWMRSKNQEDMPFTQVDPFWEVFGMEKDDDDNWHIGPDSSRVRDCPDTENHTVEYKDAPNWKEIEQRYDACTSANKTSDAEVEETRADGPDGKKDTSTSTNDAVPLPTTDEKASCQTKQSSPPPRRNGTRNDDEPSHSTNSFASSSSNKMPNSPVSANSSLSIPVTSLPTDDESQSQEKKESRSRVNTSQRTSDTTELGCLDTKTKHEKETSKLPETPPSAKKRSRAEVDDDDDDDDDDSSSRHSKRKLSDDGRT